MSDPKEQLGRPEDDPRNKYDADDQTMPGSLDDSPTNIPGDQPVDDTPPPKMRAAGTDTDTDDGHDADD